MKTLRILYHMARADFLERTRRYSFLIMLGLVVWLGYASATGILVLKVPPSYVGEINAPWVGALMTMTATVILGWFGFYLVKGSVSRDYETGVGQIMATTPLSRPIYTLGKWLSNVAVLGLMVLILMIAGVAMMVMVGMSSFSLWDLAAPLLCIAIPCVALVAALAVLFEAITWLRGGFGNVVYFLMFLVVLIPSLEMPEYEPLLDVAGIRLVSDAMEKAAKESYPECKGGMSLSFSGGSDPGAATKRFRYDGIVWTAGVVLSRCFFLAFALGIVMLAAACFDRFNPSKAFRLRRKRGDDVPELAAESLLPPLHPQLARLVRTRTGFRFDALFAAELKLLLKGHHWWWYVVALGLAIAQCAADLEITRILLAIAWVWPVLVLSRLGSREVHHNTCEIVFSAPRPVLHQLPATWLAAVTVVALLGSGALVRFLISGDAASLMAWLAGALFIPSLALAFGVLTKSSKAFEAVYVLWISLILQKAAPLDFVGVAPGSPWPLYMALAFVLLGLTAIVRQRQVTVDG